MTETLFAAYAPLLFWTGLGAILCRFLPISFPRLLGRFLYWVGVPLQIFTLARQTDWGGTVVLAPLLTIATLFSGGTIAFLALKFLTWRSLPPNSNLPTPNANPEEKPEILLPTALSELDIPLSWKDAPRRGSFLLAAMLGNTGFVGLAIVPSFIDTHNLGWAVFYSVTQNILGTYGIGVLLASYYGRQGNDRHWWTQLRDVLTVPSLWAFIIGFSTRSLPLPDILDSNLHSSLAIVISAALLLMGMRLSQLQGWKSLQVAIVPVLIKILILPTLLGLLTTLLHISPMARLTIVLMSGMPTAFAGLILAEEYDLDREMISSSIVLSTTLLLLTIPLWLFLFGH
jgi:malate permease and related proteins